MKRKLLFLVAAIIFQASYLNAQYFPVDTAKLNTAYNELMNNPNTLERQKKFFDAFPNTWMEFIMTYQYVPYSKYDLTMYSLAEKHIQALGGRVTLIKDSIYCKKLVNIAIGGKWSADAPNYFKLLLHQVMWNRMDGMLYEISQLRSGHQMQFWQFYWSNIVKSDKLKTEYERLLKINSDNYPKEMETMSIAFEYFYDGIDDINDFTRK